MNSQQPSVTLSCTYFSNCQTKLHTGAFPSLQPY